MYKKSQPPTTSKDYPPQKPQDVSPGANNVSWFERLVVNLTQTLVLAVLALGVMGLFLIHLSYQRASTNEVYYFIREIGGALFITAIVSGGAKWFVARQVSNVQKLRQDIIESEVHKKLSSLTDEVLHQTDAITKSAASLVALQDAGISKVYKSRRAAAGDIRSAIQQETESIKIIGISLNDFVRDEQTDFNRAWDTIQGRLLSEDESNRQLKVQILLIDPDCKGAILRAEAEGQTQIFSSRLRTDLEVSLSSFFDFMSKNNCPRFQVRVYNAGPMLHLVWTPASSFVEQYYFRPRHGGDINIPVLQCHSVTGSLGTPCLHEELNSHFDCIWNNASVSLSDWKTLFKRSGDRAMRAVGIESILHDGLIRRQRILRLIENEKNTTIWIKGITLHAFFQYGDLFDALCKACNRQGVGIRILLIDPLCEQATIRSFREFKIQNEKARRDQFDKMAQERQPLFRHTNETIERIQELLHGLEKPSNVQAKMFQSGPEAFILLTDEAVLVEQYHFGKLGVGKGILGGDVPLVEYRQMEHPADPLNYPYGLFKDHFEFVWKQCAVELPTVVR